MGVSCNGEARLLLAQCTAWDIPLRGRIAA
jgi:hypothetical protein